MFDRSREIGLGTLRRFLRGGATQKELRRVFHQLEVCGAESILQELALAPWDFLENDLDFRHIARQLDLYLCGALERETLVRWLGGLHQIVTSQSFESSCPASQPMARTIAVVSLLLDPDHPAAPRSVDRSLRRIRAWLSAGRPVPARTYLARIFRDMKRLELSSLESPLSFFHSTRGQWVDVGLRRPESQRGGSLPPQVKECPMRLIPFSVFTKRFFRRDLPALMARLSGCLDRERFRGDGFYYHPENNQAISLKEQFPELKEARPDFLYYTDEGGLAEIVLDVPSITRSDLLHATRLFCLKNGVRKAFLDGVRI